MYTSFYKLRARPFQLTPDPRFFFPSPPHKKAIDYLTYGLSQREGFVVITGDVGTGKTILADFLFSTLPSESFVTSKVVTTQIEPDHLVRLVAAGFGLPHEGRDKATLLTGLEAHLVRSRADHVRPLLLIDEAQNLSAGALEELRMLSNFQQRGLPLLQTFLLGQSELRAMLGRPDLAQLQQRVIASCHLQPLNAEETRGYIEHRLHQVGWQGDPRFAEECFALIFEETGGVPRKINLLCDRLMLCGYLEETRDIDARLAADVIRDLRQETVANRSATDWQPPGARIVPGPSEAPPAGNLGARKTR